MAFCIWILNNRISFPNKDILLAYINISTCFCWPRFPPDLMGAFGFIIGPLFYAASAMVFGSVASATSREPFRRAIAALALILFGDKSLVTKHKKWLDMIKWSDPPDDDVVFTQATPCSKNRGILNSDGTEKPLPHHIYVDDDLMGCIRRRLVHTLAAAIRSVFIIMGFPETFLRPYAMALDKWKLLSVNHTLIILGLLWNTRTMTVGITADYRKDAIHLLKNTWHEGRRSLDHRELERLIGKLGRIGQAYRPIDQMPMMYASVVYALRENGSFLCSTSGYGF